MRLWSHPADLAGLLPWHAAPEVRDGGQEERLAQQFEDQRPHLRAIAYRMLGSLTEADDAVQDAWLRLSRTDTSEVENLAAWLTTVVARVALNMLRTRRTRGEQPLETRVPDPGNLGTAVGHRVQMPVFDLPPAVGSVVGVELVRRDEARRAGRGCGSERGPHELGVRSVLMRRRFVDEQDGRRKA